MDNAQVLYRSASPNILIPVGMLRRKFPLPIDSPIRLSAYAFDVEFSALLDAAQNNAGGAPSIFPNVVLNTPANNATFNMPAGSTLQDANAILTTYSQPTDMGSGLGKFVGTFNRVPASWDDFTTMDWTPPGWLGTPAGATTYTARNEYPEEVTVRLHYDYFVVDPAGIVPAGILDSGGNAIVAAQGTDSLLNGNTAAKKVASASAIPYIPRTYFCNTLLNSGNPPTPIYSSHTPDLSPQGGFQSTAAFYLETFPNIQAYQVWCANVAAILAAGGNPWTGLVWDGGNGSRSATGVPIAPYLDQNQSQITQIILKDSVLKPYAGNIWQRITTYALCI